MLKYWKGLALIASIGLLATGCQTTSAQSGAMWGGGVGAIAGQLIGGDTESTLIGAGAGALGGALLNDGLNSQKETGRQEGYNAGYNAGVAQKTAPQGYTPVVQQQPQYNTAPR
jgi:osmotically inducible lipoprotein OsmB